VLFCEIANLYVHVISTPVVEEEFCKHNHDFGLLSSGFVGFGVVVAEVDDGGVVVVVVVGAVVVVVVVVPTVDGVGAVLFSMSDNFSASSFAYSKRSRQRRFVKAIEIAIYVVQTEPEKTREPANICYIEPTVYRRIPDQRRFCQQSDLCTILRVFGVTENLRNKFASF
jgi:hypothetical protein